MLNRRQFVRVVPALGAFAVSTSESPAQPAAVPGWPAAPPAGGAAGEESFPSHHPALAREMVGASHNNLARVRELLKAHPSLAKASWDWGFGDWETALGAASHVGNRAIAELLLEHGAGATIFSAAMLGQLAVVQAHAATTPRLNHQRGPHGIPLINHARAGGAAAAPVLAFLESLGHLPQTGDLQPLTDADRAALEGRYLFGARPRDVFIVDTEREVLGITRAGATRLRLTHLGRLEFHPAGAPAVRLRFAPMDGDMTLSVFDPDMVVRAVRSA